MSSAVIVVGDNCNEQHIFDFQTLTKQGTLSCVASYITCSLGNLVFVGSNEQICGYEITYNPQGTIITNKIFKARVPRSVLSLIAISTFYDVKTGDSFPLLIAGLCLGEILVWKLDFSEKKQTKKIPVTVPYLRLEGHSANNEDARCLEPISNKFVVSGGYDNKMKFWNLETGEEELSLDMGNNIFCVRYFALKDLYFYTSKNCVNAVKIDLALGKQATPVLVRTLEAANGTVFELAIFKNEYLIVTSNDMHVCVFSLLNEMPCLWKMEGHTNSVVCLAVLDDYVITAGYDSRLIVWNPETGKAERVVENLVVDKSVQVYSLSIVGDNLFLKSKEQLRKMYNTAVNKRFTDIVMLWM